MSGGTTSHAFVDEVPRLLKQRNLSLRALARQAHVSESHLSRVLRHANYKTPSPELARKVALALELPEDYFPEFREAFVIERVRRDAELREQLYKTLRSHSR